MPADIRYLPAKGRSHGALVAIARNRDGDIQAVQCVFLNDGQKAQIDVPKRSTGVLDGAAVRLPGLRGDELVIAEGPETALSVYQAWGRESWIALGSVAKLVNQLPLDRVVVIARDADQHGSEAAQALEKAMGSMANRGVNLRVAVPPMPTKAGYDFNDALQDYSVQVVENTLIGCMTVKNKIPDAVDIEEARHAVSQKIHQFFVAAAANES